MTYQFRDVGSNLTYFTMAVYNFQYGMTDRRKPQFKISVSFDNRTLTSANPISFQTQDALTHHSFKEEKGLNHNHKGYFKEMLFELDDSAL